MKRLLPLLLCLTLLLTLAACAVKPEPTQPPSSEAPTEPAEQERYAQAIALLSKKQALKVESELTYKRTVGGETLKESIKRIAAYSGLGTNALQSYVKNDMRLGASKFTYNESYTDGAVFVSYNRSNITSTGRYCAELSAEDYLARELPVVLLHLENYGKLEPAPQANGETLLTLSEATALEPWVASEDAVLKEASATVTLTADGQIAAVTYNAVYRQGATDVDMQVQCSYSDPADTDFDRIPTAPDGYQQLTDIDAVLLLLRSGLLMENAKLRGTQYSIQIANELAQASIVRTGSYSEYELDGDYLFHSDFQVVFNSTATGEQQTTTVSEDYNDGIYTYTLDGESTQSDFSDDTYFHKLVTDDLSACFCTPSLLTDATVTDTGDCWLIECTFDPAAGDALETKYCSYFYDDSSILRNETEDYSTLRLTAAVALEKDNYLPTSFTREFVGAYTYNGTPAPVIANETSVFRLSTPALYREITGEDLPEEAPAEPATPLFYEVTGQNGEKLYLLGTIHVGDERTAYLPQEIYDAFDAADALAVEFDTDEFLEMLENDPELAASVAKAYVYEDGSEISEHLDEQLYQDALARLKTTGSYNVAMSSMRASVWTNILEQFFLRLGRTLDAEKGVDNRLMARANEKGKEILGVESGEAQLAMLMGFSDALQAAQLKEIVNTTSHAYMSGVESLYESWCRGDEAELTKLVSADNEGLSPELYQEYHKAMITDRNAGMHETAVGYLQSGRTVFYAVGLGHLLTDEGLVNSLRAVGYTVTLVKFA